MSTERSFSFGKNWKKFIQDHFTEERVKIAQAHLLSFLGMENLEGKYFLDIGCGSGIHSLAAYESKAAKIISFDVDPFSVETAKKICQLKGSPKYWEIVQESILDKSLIQKILPADIVYSWGVLHHTGDLWGAIRNASQFLKKGSLFYIAVYVKTPESDYWISVKKKYNRSSLLIKRYMEIAYVVKHFFIAKMISAVKRLSVRKPFLEIVNSIKYMKNYKKSRGMAFWTDVRDWLGGWPYEPATEEEICQFCERELGLEKIKVKTGEANIEYLFKKS